MTAPREPYPDLAYEEHLAYEREQDRLAGEILEGQEDFEAAPAPPARGIPATTAVLGVLLVGFLFLLAGIELQKLLGTPAPTPAPAGGPAGGEASRDGLTAGQIVAVRGRILYVREPDGHIVKLRTGPDSRLALGRPVGPAAIRPGQEVVVQSSPRAGADAPVRSVTVVPPRERDGH